MAQGKTTAPQDVLSELGVDDLYGFIGADFKATDKEVLNFNKFVVFIKIISFVIFCMYVN